MDAETFSFLVCLLCGIPAVCLWILVSFVVMPFRWFIAYIMFWFCAFSVKAQDFEPDRRPEEGLALATTFNTGVAQDYSHYAVANGTITSGASLSSQNLYAFFTGAGHIEFADANQYSFVSGTQDLPFTVCAWVMTSNPSARQFLVSKRNVGNYEWYSQILSDGTQGFSAVCATQTAGGLIGREQTTSLICPYKWYHFAFVYSGGKTSASFKVFQDGLVVDDSNYQALPYTNMVNGTAPVRIGAIEWTELKWQGAIDDVRIYDRAFAAAEVMGLMQSTKGEYR